ncbi:FecR family protein [Pseudomonas flavescens]|uniref:FecR family protein n=1 Tax=Phytopseudomonas flavescens TaxID=29435 RepID=A0A1G8AJX5_9GAMM|nr:FecR family protein [Pseudomonas flavescens]SDH21143.1 FecR family protein [Pseudomonas flavescens]
MNSPDLQDRAIRQAAADWAVRMSDSPLDEDEQQALQAWLACDPRHGAALQFARHTWGDLAGLAAPSADVARLSPSQRPPASPRRRRRVLRWLSSASLAVIVTAIGWTQGPALYLPLVADHLTASGEVRTFELPDGSQATLDARSAIRLDYTAQARRVELLAGSAIFQTAPVGKHESRPFIVASAGGKAQALGTRFLVRRDDAEQTLVGVMQHRVAVSKHSQSLILEEGQSARYDANGRIERLDLDLARAGSWQRGLLIFDQVPLEQVVQQLNRYRAGRILIADGQLAQRRVSGVFRLDSLEGAVATLTDELHVGHRDLLGVSLIY